MNRLAQFFEADDKRLSLSRLTLFGSFLIASAIMLILSHFKLMNEGYFGMYLTAYSGTYLMGKKLDQPVKAAK